MKIKFQPVLSILLACLVVYAGIIGRYQTLYGLGMLAVISLLVYGAIIFGILFFILKVLLKKERSKATWVSMNIVQSLLVVILIAFVVSHYASRYKPTKSFYIPDDFIGCIYIFETTPEYHSDTISENGIAYIHWDSDYTFRLERNGVDVTDAFSLGNSRGAVNFYHEDSTIMESISVDCALINDSNYYPEFSVYTTVWPEAMHPSTYEEMVKWGWIDDSRVLRWKHKRIDKLSKWSVSLGKFVGDEKVD